jgi:hypothetical protein
VEPQGVVIAPRRPGFLFGEGVGEKALGHFVKGRGFTLGSALEGWICSLLDVSQERFCLLSGFVGRQPPVLADDKAVRSTILPVLGDIGLQASGVDDDAKPL